MQPPCRNLSSLLGPSLWTFNIPAPKFCQEMELPNGGMQISNEKNAGGYARALRRSSQTHPQPAASIRKSEGSGVLIGGGGGSGGSGPDGGGPVGGGADGGGAVGGGGEPNGIPGDDGVPPMGKSGGIIGI